MTFLILPDSPAGTALAEGAGERVGPRVIPHASGRPWLVGRWSGEDLILVTAGTRRLAVFGTASLDTSVAARLLGTARSPHDLDGVARMLHGAVHLAASIDGWTRTQGSVSTARQVFTARACGMTVAASDPDPLRTLVGARLDEEALALRLLTGTPSLLLHRYPVWSRVVPVAPGCWLRVGPDGEGHAVRWWHPPEPAVPFVAAVDATRTALCDAVAVRARRPLSADLSGGMDSTSLCFLAAAAGADLRTHHWKPLDRANTDTEWAERAASHLPGARHLSIPAHEAPAWYEVEPAPGTARAVAEGPLLFFRTRAHLRYLSQAMSAAGSAVHLMGVGGDELFGVLPTWPYSLLRSRPVRAIPTIHRFRMINRWGLASTVRGLADRVPFDRALRIAAGRITAPAPAASEAVLGWMAELRMPPWASGEAVGAVRRLLLRTASTCPRPRHPDRLQHQTLDGATLCGIGVRQLNADLAAFGVRYEAPYLDDRVLEAALSVRIEDRVVPGTYKPVLAAAMGGLVPDEILRRHSKGGFLAEAYEGLHRNRHRLVDLCDDLHLARLGLVDPRALRAALLTPLPDGRQLGPFENTLSCEAWLRSLNHTATGTPGSATAPTPLTAGDPS